MTIWDVMRAVRGAPGLDPSARLLMLEILDRAGNGRGTCYASNATLGRAVNLGERHVTNCIKDLEKFGWIFVMRAGASKHGRRTIHIPNQWMPDAPGTTVLGAGEMHPEPQFQPVGTTVPTDQEPQFQQTSPERQPERRTDGEDVSHRTGGGGGVDRNAVLRIVRECCTHLPNDTLEKLEARRDVGAKLGEDWEALALALVRVDAGRRASTIQHIRHTVGFLLTVAKSVRGKEPPTEKERTTLAEMLDGTYKPPLKPGPVFYKPGPGEIIPLPSERRPNAEAYRYHTAPPDSPYWKPPKPQPKAPVFTQPPDDLTQIYHPAKLAKWAAQKPLTPHQADMESVRAIASAPLPEDDAG